MNVFVSGKIGSEQDPAEFMRLLESRGHTITFDWTRIPHLRPYEENALQAQEAAILELDGVKAASVLVLLMHERGVGMFVEMGAALAFGKPVIVVAEPPARSMFLMHPQVKIVGTQEEALDIVDLAHAVCPGG